MSDANLLIRREIRTAIIECCVLCDASVGNYLLLLKKPSVNIVACHALIIPFTVV